MTEKVKKNMEEIEKHLTGRQNAALKWIHDARAFIEYATRRGMSNTAILHNLAHDIYGLAEGEQLMLPRVDGYAKAHPYKIIPEITEHDFGSSGEVTGSSRGALLPLLNNKNNNAIPAMLKGRL